MVAGAERLREAREAAAFGVLTGPVASTSRPSWRAKTRYNAASRRRRAPAQGAQGRGRGRAGHARRPRSAGLDDGRELTGDAVILASGSEPVRMRPLRLDRPASDDQRRAAHHRPCTGEPAHRRRRRDRLRVRLRLRAARHRGHGRRDAGPAAARRGQADRAYTAAGLQEDRHHRAGEDRGRRASASSATPASRSASPAAASSPPRACWSPSAADRSAAAWASTEAGVEIDARGFVSPTRRCAPRWTASSPPATWPDRRSSHTGPTIRA